MLLIVLLLGALSLLPACGKDESKAEDKGTDTGTDTGTDSGEEGGASAVKLKDGIKALALTKSGLGLVAGDESNFRAVTDEGLVTPWNQDIPVDATFKQMFATETQVLLYNPKSAGLYLDETPPAQSQPVIDESGVYKGGQYFDTFKVGPNIAVKWPELVRIDRASGKLEWFQGGSVSNSSPIQKDEAGNLYLVMQDLSQDGNDKTVLRKIAPDGSLSTVLSFASGDDTVPDVKVHADGTMLFRFSQVYKLFKDGKQTKVAEGTYIWSEKMPDGNLYFGAEGLDIARYTSAIEASWFNFELDPEAKGEAATKVPGKDEFIGIVKGANEAWAVYKSKIQKVYPGTPELSDAPIQVEAATVYDNKLVLVGEGKVLLAGEEVASGLGDASTIELKGSKLMVATSNQVVEIDLSSKAKSEVQTGGAEISTMQAL